MPLLNILLFFDNLGKRKNFLSMDVIKGKETIEKEDGEIKEILIQKQKEKNE